MEDLLKVAASSEPSSWTSVYAPKTGFPLLYSFVQTSLFLHRFLLFLQQFTEKRPRHKWQTPRVCHCVTSPMRKLTRAVIWRKFDVWRHEFANFLKVANFVFRMKAHEIDAFHTHWQFFHRHAFLETESSCFLKWRDIKSLLSELLRQMRHKLYVIRLEPAF